MVSFPLAGGWRKIPCLFASGYPDLSWATLRCNTIHGKKKDSLNKLVKPKTLKKYVIEPKSTKGMQRDLKIMGITHTSAFPDLDNLARDWSEIF
ncbi:MAG TPA: hypothetical protein VLM80_02645 [Anaerolineales bacterium]|nr:hypothetical protein [Anaerolineales bacterium]